jgi:hypothetical protein
MGALWEHKRLSLFACVHSIVAHHSGYASLVLTIAILAILAALVDCFVAFFTLSMAFAGGLLTSPQVQDSRHRAEDPRGCERDPSEMAAVTASSALLRSLKRRLCACHIERACGPTAHRERAADAPAAWPSRTDARPPLPMRVRASPSPASAPRAPAALATTDLVAPPPARPSIVAIDVGIVHLGFAVVSTDADGFSRPSVDLLALVNITQLDRALTPDCPASNELADRMRRLFNHPLYGDALRRAAAIYPERQPRCGHHAPEQLLLFHYRDKAALIAPTSVQAHFGISGRLGYDYQRRKSAAVHMLHDAIFAEDAPLRASARVCVAQQALAAWRAGFTSAAGTAGAAGAAPGSPPGDRRRHDVADALLIALYVLDRRMAKALRAPDGAAQAPLLPFAALIRPPAADAFLSPSLSSSLDNGTTCPASAAAPAHALPASPSISRACRKS